MHVAAMHVVRGGIRLQWVPCVRNNVRAGQAAPVPSSAAQSLPHASGRVPPSPALPAAEGLRFEKREFWSCFALEDQKEGMAAFVGKRKPEFKDR